MSEDTENMTTLKLRDLSLMHHLPIMGAGVLTLAAILHSVNLLIV